MQGLVQDYFETPSKGYELEARFGDRSISKLCYKRVGQRLANEGFEASEQTKTLRVLLPNGYRVEVDGLLAIQSYMTKDKLPPSARFVKKTKEKVVDSDFGVRLALSEEKVVESVEVQRFRENWSNTVKQHRLIDRMRFTNKAFPHWSVDCSAVKCCYNKVYRVAESALASAVETYEVEAEVVALENAERAFAELKHLCVIVLGGIQNTQYPVTKTRLAEAAERYRRLTKIDADLPPNARFIGPNPVAMQAEHLFAHAPPPPQGGTEGTGDEEIVNEGAVVSVLNDYAVTDKADGARKLLFVDEDGFVFFVTPRMAFEFCNIHCPSLAGSVLDGEFVEFDKTGNYIGLFAAFDVYFFKGDDCRALPLLGATRNRNELLLKAVADLEPFRQPIIAKTFYTDRNVHAACAKCFGAALDYATDGLIFTPVSKGVGVSATGAPPPNKCFTWDICYKWKTPQDTTVDFKVLCHEKLEDRHSVLLGVLCRGNRAWDRPQLSLLEQKTAHPFSTPGIRPFLTDEDPYSHTTFIPLHNGDMVTETGEIIYPNAIVEFRYDPTRADMWRWVPTRVRWDKETPNAFETAHNNWNYLMRPLTEEMLKGTAAAPKDDRYYLGNRRAMHNLRLFHGSVKEQLLAETVKLIQAKENTEAINLFDFGVGQGGDLWRWRNQNISFVLGIDLSAHNIKNKQNGACMRYLTSATGKNNLRVLFAVADMCDENLLSADPHPNASEVDRLIVLGALGKIGKAAVDMYPNLAVHYNVSFHITAAMFSVHYAFKNSETLARFATNVAGSTALGGYFIGTCWDGDKVFQLLTDTEKNGAVTIDEVRIEKMYSKRAFQKEPVGVGYAIEVSQATFNPAVEYLVDLVGLETVLRANGFKLIKLKSYDTYYKEYMEGKRPPLSDTEKKLSFLNVLFIYQKVE